jgi:LysR family transcriptional regulator, low CO2-responsive transcriptional regulator
MHYTLHQLKVFLKIVETKSITQAANLLHLSQPAISIQLKNFQDQFDIPLTEVVGRKLFITPFGFDIAESAISILNEVENMNTKIQQRKKNLVGPLKITSVSTGKYVIPYYISDFVNQHHDVGLQNLKYSRGLHIFQ